MPSGGAGFSRSRVALAGLTTTGLVLVLVTICAGSRRRKRWQQLFRKYRRAFSLGGDPLTRRVGWVAPFPHGGFSCEAARRAAAFSPRASDVFILTAPKTGTTWLQMICHALRTGGRHVDFEDIYQVVPWDQMAWDLGQDLDSEQVATPRVFKTHIRLSSINRGGRYLCLVREEEATLLSWWRFLREKDVPPLRKYSTPSEFVFDKDFVADGMRFGASIWEYYAEFAQCLDVPSVLVLCFEDLVDDLTGHLDLIADFIGVSLPDPEAKERILRLCSKEGMSAASAKFDESWTFAELQRINRCPDGAESFRPAKRVHLNAPQERLDEIAQNFLRQQWREQVFPTTGFENYAALRGRVREELERRRRPLRVH